MYCAMSEQWSNNQQEKKMAAKCNNGTESQKSYAMWKRGYPLHSLNHVTLEETTLQAPPRTACSVKTGTTKGPQEMLQVVEMVCNLTWAMVTRVHTLVITHPAANLKRIKSTCKLNLSLFLF